MQPFFAVLLTSSSELAHGVTNTLLLQGIPNLSETTKSLSLVDLSGFHLNLFKVEGFRHRSSFAPPFCLSCKHSLLGFRTHELFQAAAELRA